METDRLAEIDKGFSSIYEEYEKLSKENYIDIYRRTVIRSHVEKYLKPGQSILEINAGSGIDAVYFGNKGYNVLATDIAENSEKYILGKKQLLGLTNLEFLKCSFSDLNSIDQTFDHIFSNYGGLNCTDDLQTIFAQFKDLLNPEGYVSMVIMPPVYPWEIVTVLKGNLNAFRRFNKKGTIAKINNHMIRVFYHSPRKIKEAMGTEFKPISTKNIGTFYPSQHFSSLQRFRKLISALMNFDSLVNNSPFIMKGIGDYFIITFQKIN